MIVLKSRDAQPQFDDVDDLAHVFDFSRFEEDESDALAVPVGKDGQVRLVDRAFDFERTVRSDGCRCDGRIFGIALHQEYGVRDSRVQFAGDGVGIASASHEGACGKKTY